MIVSVFKNKRITMLGLGLLGRGVGVAKFLSGAGAKLTITDLKAKKGLAPSLRKLKNCKNIKYILGRHRLKDFRNKDMAVKAAGTPFNSPFIKEAKKNKISVEMDASLFAKSSPATIIGITGTRGKSTTTFLIYNILKQAEKRVFLGGNIRGTATLPLLNKARKGDYVVLELDSWQLQGFGDSKISPHVAVFTTFMPDHMNYYKHDMQKYFDDKANIFKYQKLDDYLIVGESAREAIRKYCKKKIKSSVTIAGGEQVPKNWKLKIIGSHNLDNISCAMNAVSSLNLKSSVIKKAVENFTNLPGRLELVMTYGGIKIYNDTNSTTPDAVIAGIRALSKNKNIVLIFGGFDKNLDASDLISLLPRYCKSVILIPGTGTDKVGPMIKKLPVHKTQSLKKAVDKSFELVKKQDIILFSPGFASFGMFKNEYDRGNKFNKLIKKRG